MTVHVRWDGHADPDGRNVWKFGSDSNRGIMFVILCVRDFLEIAM